MHGITANGYNVSYSWHRQGMRDELTAYEKFQPHKNNEFFWLLQVVVVAVVEWCAKVFSVAFV